MLLIGFVFQESSRESKTGFLRGFSGEVVEAEGEGGGMDTDLSRLLEVFDYKRRPSKSAEYRRLG